MANNDPEDERVLRDLLESAMAFHAHGLMPLSAFLEIRALCEPASASALEQVADLGTQRLRQ